MLNVLEEHDLIETGIIKNNRTTPLASIDLAIYRAIYREIQAVAVVHADAPYATALSLIKKEIVPGKTEGSSEISAVFGAGLTY